MSYTGLSSGAYNVSVQDANGCISTIIVNLTEPLPFSINYTIDNLISCPGICDGSVSVLNTNGISPILYDMTGYSTQTSQSWTGMWRHKFWNLYIERYDDNGWPANKYYFNRTLPLFIC